MPKVLVLNPGYINEDLLLYNLEKDGNEFIIYKTKESLLKALESDHKELDNIVICGQIDETGEPIDEAFIKSVIQKLGDENKHKIIVALNHMYITKYCQENYINVQNSILGIRNTIKSKEAV